MGQDNNTANKSKLVSTLMIISTIISFAVIAVGLIVYLTLPKITTDDLRENNPEHKKLYSIKLDSLTYSGLDYYKDGAKIGGYYYATPKSDVSVSGRYLFVLVKDKDTPSVIDDYSAKVICFTDKERLQTITNILSDDTGISADELELMSRPYILSEIDFPFNIIISVGIICLLIIVLNTFHFIKKHK